MKTHATETDNIGRVNNTAINGDTKSISNGKDQDYISKIEMILPHAYRVIPDDQYYIEYKGNKITIIISTINKKEVDPIFHNAKIYQTMEKSLAIQGEDGE